MKTSTQTVAHRFPSAFSWLTILTAGATYGLVVLGGVVRSTGSGDACPDWPRCRGDLLPPLEQHVLIEFSHRLTASVVGLLVLATALFAWRSQRHLPAVVWGSGAAVVLVVAQIILGGATVLKDLSGGLVMAHLALATALLSTLLFVAVESLGPRPAGRSPADERGFRNLALVSAAATFGLIMSGAYVSGSGAGLAFSDWPLFNGRLLPEGGRLAMIHATHRFAALAVGLLLVYLAAHAWRSYRWSRPAVIGTTAAVALYAAQALVGAANVWTRLAPATNAAHLALATALLSTLLTVALLSNRRVRVAQPLEQQPPLPSARPAHAAGSVPVGRPG